MRLFAFGRSRSWLLGIINETLYPGRVKGGWDGPLRDTDTNRDINTKRSFIFFYVPTRTRRPPRRILTRTSSPSLWKFLSSFAHRFLPILSRSAFLLLRSSTFVLWFYSLCFAVRLATRFTLRRWSPCDGEFYDSLVSSLYSNRTATHRSSNWSRFLHRPYYRVGYWAEAWPTLTTGSWSLSLTSSRTITFISIYVSRNKLRERK